MQKFFFIKSDRRYVKLSFDEIRYIQGCKNYIKIVTEKKTYLVLFSMKSIENFLPVDLFRRIHKSYIVSLDKVIAFDGDAVYLSDKELPIGLQYSGELEKGVLIARETAANSVSAELPYFSVPKVVKSSHRKRVFKVG